MTVKRCHIHFAGFEQLTANIHRRRFVRACRSASNLWGCKFGLSDINSERGTFTINGKGEGWSAQTNVLVIAPSDLVSNYLSEPVLKRIFTAYGAFFKGIFNGAIFRYFMHAPRFGFFAVFPFIYMAAGFILPLFIANGLADYWVWNAVWAFPLAIAFSVYFFVPLTDKIHIHFLFASWRFGISMAEMKNEVDVAWVDSMQARVQDHLDGNFDEIIITSHSMGSITASHIVGALLEKNPDLFDGQQVTFAPLGGAVLASAFMRPGKLLRERVGLIGSHENVRWLDIQCLMDIMNFYKCDPVALCGFSNPLRKTDIIKIRFRHLLNTKSYKTIKQDFLKMHLQFVSGADVKYIYDFIPFIAGPYIADERITRLKLGKLALDESHCGLDPNVCQPDELSK